MSDRHRSSRRKKPVTVKERKKKKRREKNSIFLQGFVTNHPRSCAGNLTLSVSINSARVPSTFSGVVSPMKITWQDFAADKKIGRVSVLSDGHKFNVNRERRYRFLLSLVRESVARSTSFLRYRNRT